MGKIDKVRIRRIGVEALGICWILTLMFGVWHAMQFHPMNIPILVAYLVLVVAILSLYIYLAYVRLL